MAGRRSTGGAPDGEKRPVGVLAPGDVVAGVELTALVGAGGSGTVWSGTELASGARVALKLLRTDDADDAGDAGDAGRLEAARAVAREAALLAGVRHPHVLGVRRVCEDPPALVTELASGGSLAAQVAARGTFAPGEVVTVLAPLGDALAALHARGVVHGDVTASNVLFVDRGRPVLADLGVAGLAGDGVAWATPGFAAPEVVAGGRPGAAADVHGLGAVGWLALTGSVPPVEEDRLPLGLLAPDCPLPLVQAVTAALDPDPGARPAPEDLAAAARAACPGLAVHLVPGAALGVRADEAVTSRVREAAAADLPPDRGAWWAPRPRGGRAGARPGGRRGARHDGGPGPRRDARPDAGRGGPPGPRRDCRPGGSRPGRRLVVGSAAGVLVAALGAAAVLLPGGDGRPAAGAASPGRVPHAVSPSTDQPPTAQPATAQPATAQPAAAPPATLRPADASSGSAQPVAGPSDLAAVVVGLVTAREEALRGGDVAALARVHAADGATMAADRELLADGPVDVGYEVLGVDPVPGRPGRAALRLRTTAAGTSTTEDVVLELVDGADGWRVGTVTPGQP